MGGTSLELELPSRWMNQAGTLGFSPMLSLQGINQVFVTNPVSYRPRLPSSNRDFLPYPGGFLLHTGLTNPGWKAIRKKYAAHWAQNRMPVWLHLICQDLELLKKIILECEELDGISAIELGVPPGCTPDELRMMTVTAQGEIPLVLSISVGDIPELRRHIPPSVSAITLAAPRGRAVNEDGTVISGRLHGPGIFPMMLDVLFSLRGGNIPIILGGICNRTDGETALQNGAAAVQMDRLCWMGDLPGQGV